MKCKRVMIAAPKSGSGKTTITCALLAGLKCRGEQAVSYKCGPDYIDPMYHRKIIGVPSKNLDTFFTGEEETKELFLKNRFEEDFAVLEGVMGLYDGLGGICREGSSYHLAKATKTPIVLVVDAKGMGRSVIALAAGFLSYDRECLIKGILLNRISKPLYELIKPLMEAELSIRVLGYLPEQKQFSMKSRHLGLLLPDELEDIQEQMKVLAEELEKTVSIEAVMQIAEEAEELEDSIPEKKEAFNNRKAECGAAKQRKNDTAEAPVIAVARDEAFCFYYEDNLLMLQEKGAVLAYFSPIHDSRIPEACSGLLIGGGYPELYAKELSENKEMLESVKQAAESGMPVVAECGGFLYLHSELEDSEGTCHRMAGAIQAKCYDRKKLVRFGYIELEEKESSFLPKGERIKGHEFHYFDSSNNGSDCLAIKPATGKSYPCIFADENIFVGFPHLYYPSNPVFAENFVEKAEKYMKRKGESDGTFLSFF